MKIPFETQRAGGVARAVVETVQVKILEGWRPRRPCSTPSLNRPGALRDGRNAVVVT